MICYKFIKIQDSYLIIHYHLSHQACIYLIKNKIKQPYCKSFYFFYFYNLQLKINTHTQIYSCISKQNVLLFTITRNHSNMLISCHFWSLLNNINEINFFQKAVLKILDLKVSKFIIHIYQHITAWISCLFVNSFRRPGI